MSANEIASRVRDIVHNVARGKTIKSNDADLFADGVLDSFAAVEILSELEAAFGIALPVEELTLQNFQTVTAITRLIGRLAG